jgi:hypothetical protein
MLKRIAQSVRTRGVRGTLPLAPAVAIEALGGILSSPVRRRYVKRLGAEATAPLSPGAAIDLSVTTFAQEIDVPELVVSIRSFLMYVGVPREFVVISDGTITEESRAVIQAILPSTVSVQSIDEYAGPSLPEPVRAFMAKSPWGTKLASIMTMADRAPGLYVDSDVMCFPHASELRMLCEGEVPLFMLDVAPHLDQRMLPDQSLEDVAAPVNAGMLFAPKPLDWTLSLSRLGLLHDEEPSGYTEQTAVHLAFHRAGGQPFPPDRYIVSPLRMRPLRRIGSRNLCARHYTRPQRGLFWLQVARSDLAERNRK